MKNPHQLVTFQIFGRSNTSPTLCTPTANIERPIKYHKTNKQSVRIRVYNPRTVGYSDTGNQASALDVPPDWIETKDTCSAFDRMEPDCREFLQAELAAGLIR